MFLTSGQDAPEASIFTKDSMQLALPALEVAPAPSALASPEAYKGLYAFHKYWGKKPAEPLRYLIEHVTPVGGLVIDPFLGSGISVLEAIQLRRRAVGIDVNPAAVRISRLLAAPPTAEVVRSALSAVKKKAKARIFESYGTSEGRIATHFVWNGPTLSKVWVEPEEGRTRVELEPSHEDLALLSSYGSYEPELLRNPRFFKNSRINSYPELSLRDLFTGRALRNIELLLSAINELPSSGREAMLLSLTAAVGQMSRMVFAITNRGKSSGRESGRMEVGSWVIGYWRPQQHFEVNVWKCFERRADKLAKAVSGCASTPTSAVHGTIREVCESSADYAIVQENSLDVIQTFPDGSVDLVVTDPPHSDRIPYLELSELWNVILGEAPPFEPEIVVSNARERGKTESKYNEAMLRFLRLCAPKLTESGTLVLFFNAREEASWAYLDQFSANAGDAGMDYIGCFPLVYSASSVVQDNRDGALRTDYGLVFSRSGSPRSSLLKIPGWMARMPRPRT